MKAVLPGSGREWIRPLSPPAGPRTWPLTAIDRYAFQWVIQGTWVFDAFLDSTALKRGLARILDAYPILCGRVVHGSRIEWREGGVPFSEEVEPEIGFRDFDAAAVNTAKFAERPTPAQVQSGKAPLLTLKLTRLRDGSVLTLCAAHACVDGNGFYSLARSLSLATTGKVFPAPLFERQATPGRARRRSELARDARRQGWQRMTVLDLLRFGLSRGRLDRSFVAHFSPAALARCKDELARTSGTPHLSTNSALLAHIVHCLAALLDLSPRSSFIVSSAVDMRGRVRGVAEAFAGNAVALIGTPEIPCRAAPPEIAARLHERLANASADSGSELASTTRLAEEVAGHRLSYGPLRLSRMLGTKPTLFYTNSFAKFPVYDLDFGDESRPIRPTRVVPHNLGDPILLWPAPSASGGIDLYLCGNLAHTVRRLREDDPWRARLRRFDTP